jgi:hypothetical protein
MLDRWTIGLVVATAALFVLGGCAWFEPGPTDFPSATGEECTVLTTALEKIVDDWRTNPRRRILEVDTYAISADFIDNDYESRLTGLLPPKGAQPIDVSNCGTLLASVSNRVQFISPAHGIPGSGRDSCWRSDGGWISRPGFDADRTRAAVLYSDDVCGERSWLVRMSKDYRGIWVADAPDPLERAAATPAPPN